ncbi:MAG: chaperone modulator CbpM [Hahellaceae bacterium]|jgi:chaperone modulatory protein CbpM|nr:chaperone modulator CbpM [Hahellaceae bacterium]
MKSIHQEVEILGTGYIFSLKELCLRGGVSADYVLELVAYGILEPIDENVPPRFETSALGRLRSACRLQQDLRVNLPGLAMTLDLLDEVKQLRDEVIHLRRQLRHYQ